MYLFTSESVSPGHPDKCADIIADTIVDRLLQLDPNARVATEVFISGKHIMIGGEVKIDLPLDEDFYHLCVQDALTVIGYPEAGFSEEETLDPSTLNIEVFISRQSPDISIGVDRKSGETGAGDQGMMIGYACDETPQRMPSAIVWARVLRDALYDYALGHPERFGVDIKTQVSVDYGDHEGFVNGEVRGVARIVAAVPHSADLEIEEARAEIKEVIIRVLEREQIPFDRQETEFVINGTGRYVKHSPLADSGLSGRKVVCDTYGAYAPIGGGSQSSKDYTKVDRSGLYAARWIAKHIVASGSAKKALVEIAYVIGRANPLHVTVDTQGTGKIDDTKLGELITEKFPLTPDWITKRFGLDTPSQQTFLYADVAARGQVGIEGYPWERLDEEVLSWFRALS
ncbi:MAG: methionine adenosyltransferase [Campylobacteraceae bacterium 4484_4]|nr:MAG: methionine adenosyltransferase [Campylobacteraceae bacterium 4484_4]